MEAHCSQAQVLQPSTSCPFVGAVPQQGLELSCCPALQDTCPHGCRQRPTDREIKDKAVTQQNANQVRTGKIIGKTKSKPQVNSKPRGQQTSEKKTPLFSGKLFYIKKSSFITSCYSNENKNSYECINIWEATAYFCLLTCTTIFR